MMQQVKPDRGFACRHNRWSLLVLLYAILMQARPCRLQIHEGLTVRV